MVVTHTSSSSFNLAISYNDIPFRDTAFAPNIFCERQALSAIAQRSATLRGNASRQKVQKLRHKSAKKVERVWIWVILMH